MDSLIHAACPRCHVEGDVPPQYAGKVIRCRKCGQQFAVPTPNLVAHHSAQPKAGCQKGLADLNDLDDVGLAPMSQEELEHEERIKKKMMQQMRDM